MAYSYINRVKELIETIEKKESVNIEKAIELLTETILSKKSIYVFGASHAGILSEESFYRAGGLMPITPIWANEVLVSREPITSTSRMERLVGYGTQIMKNYPIGKDDVLIVHSVSGRNPVTIECAMYAREKGAKVIGVTNLEYSKNVSSRHPSGKNMYQFCDIVLDNHGDIGDACVQIKGTNEKTGPTSTVIGALILNTIYSEVANRLVDKGMDTPPVFYSANIDGGDEKNQKLYEMYKDSIHYRF